MDDRTAQLQLLAQELDRYDVPADARLAVVSTRVTDNGLGTRLRVQIELTALPPEGQRYFD